MTDERTFEEMVALAKDDCELTVEQWAVLTTDWSEANKIVIGALRRMPLAERKVAAKKIFDAPERSGWEILITRVALLSDEAMDNLISTF